MWPLLVALLACTPTEVEPEDSGSLDDTDDVAFIEDAIEIDTGTAGELTGTIPSETLEAPTFTATNYDESKRTAADLRGKATVMWFYPIATTPG